MPMRILPSTYLYNSTVLDVYDVQMSLKPTTGSQVTLPRLTYLLNFGLERLANSYHANFGVS